MENELYHNQADFAELPKNALILDVRNGNEHSDAALKRKHDFIELFRFDAKEFIERNQLNGEWVYVLCRSGKRASVAARKLEEAGYENVAIIRGGMNALQNNAEIVSKRSGISIERQVRIIAGLLVAVGSLASYWVPAGSVVAGLVGCGLVYAGISNSCAMASLLTKMPWNK